MMYRFEVQEMSCGHCVSQITKSVKEADPDAQVEVDLKAGTVQIQSGLSQDDLSAIIEEAGYPIIKGTQI